MRASVYVDGFNLYYGLKRFERQGRSYKWLNLLDLCRAELPNDTIHRIRYFTALIQCSKSWWTVSVATRRLLGQRGSLAFV